MSSLLFMAEPSDLLWELAEDHLAAEHEVLAPFGLPEFPRGLVPASLARFVDARAGHPGRSLPGFALAELAARAWSRGKTDRLVASKLQFRRAAGAWAVRQGGAPECILAPSLGARALFARHPRAHKILVLDLPWLRRLHQDLDRAYRADPACGYLQRYRAPDWAIVRQEAELRMADQVIVRGRYVRDALDEWGLPADRVVMHLGKRMPRIVARSRRGEGLHLRLAGLAAARHGTRALLAVLDERPWLHLYLRDGQGAEPRELFEHPRTHAASEAPLEEMDGLVAPALCESYLPELSEARSLDLPIIASKAAAGAFEPSGLFGELPTVNARALGLVVDSLYAAQQVQPDLPLGATPRGPLIRGYAGLV